MAAPIGGMISSAAYCASQILKRQQEDDDNYWNSLSKEEKDKIIKAELSYYKWKKECEIREANRKYQKRLLRIEKRKNYIKNVKKFIDDNFLMYFYALLYKFFNLKTPFIFIPIEFYQYSFIFDPIKRINLNDLDIVARILKSTHNCNFVKVKELIYYKFKDVEDRKKYLEKIYTSFKFFTDKDMFILNKIFKINK